jgi:hypothetical protein
MERAENFQDCENSKRVAFLDTLLKYKKQDETITFEDIQEEVDTFMFEGLFKHYFNKIFLATK